MNRPWKIGDRIKILKDCDLVLKYRTKPNGSSFYQDAFQRIPVPVGTVLVVAHESTRWDKTQAALPSFWVEGMSRPTFEMRPKINSHGRVLYTERVKIDDANAFWPDGSAKPNYQRADGRLSIEHCPSGFPHLSSIKLDESYFRRLKA